ncbi:MAG TPA: hypothetical protein VFG14_12085 [Chthoniobacteraceae bacterium]|nr:hypothetical protein [Chthoniobacteraceae bacterium]
MLFAAGGRSVSQERIVETAYGRQYNLPAFAPVQIASLTNRDWVDENGDTFSSNLVAAYDAFAGVNTMNNDMIIEALAQDQPMVVCNTHHAMLLTAATYIPTPYGPNITNVGFFDPWPGRGLRGPDSLAEGRTTNIGGQITYIGLAEIE